MSATVEARQVTRYYCTTCGRGWQRKGMAEAHARKCWRDPDNRACPTCKHYGGRDLYEPDTGYSERKYCQLGCWYQDDAWHRDCEKWEPKS